MRLILLGPPGAGKGTQGQRLMAEYGVPHVATGDIVRDHIARGTEFGHQVEAAIAAGNFAPDADIIYWVRQRLSEPDAAAGYILDGFPRDLAQGIAWDQECKKQNKPLNAVLELAIAAEALIQRLSGRLVCPVDGETYHKTLRPPRVPGKCDLDGTPLIRRPDDEPDAVRHRLRVYEDLTLPLRDHYAAQGILHSVAAERDAETVSAEILAALRNQ